MTPIPAHIQTALNTLAQQKAQELLAKATSVITAARLTATKELLNSLAVDVKAASETDPPMVSLLYKDHGRFLDYKNPVWNKVPDLKKLEKWVAAKGVSSFRYVSGVGSTRLSNEAQIKKIAAGVAWAKRKHSQWKAKGWKRKTLVKIVKQMNADTVTIWERGIEYELTASLEKP